MIENSLRYDLVSCLPVVGIIPSMIDETSLKNKILNTYFKMKSQAHQASKTKLKDRLIELFELKAQHKGSSSVRNALTALLAMCVALRVLVSPVATIAIGICMGFLGIAITDMYEVYLLRERVIKNLLAGKALSFDSMLKLA